MNLMRHSPFRVFARAALAAGLLAGLAAGPARAADAGKPADESNEAVAQTPKEGGKKLVVFIAGTPSHEWGGHEHRAGCYLLAKCLGESLGDKIQTKVYTNGWPKDAHALDGADAVVMYCDGGNGHMALSHLKEIEALAAQGVGIGCIHYGVEPGDEKKQGNGREEFLRWIGGYFETFFSVNPHWMADFKQIPRHEVTRGVKPFRTNDEWYYHMRFRPEMQGVALILSAVPPDATRKGKDDAHGGNPAVREGLGKGIPETTVWVSERPVEGGAVAKVQRGFGCTGGHVHWNWAQDDFRRCILNSIAWITHVEVPEGGVNSKTPTVDDLLAHMDNERKKVPADFSKERKQKDLDLLNRRETAGK